MRRGGAQREEEVAAVTVPSLPKMTRMTFLIGAVGMAIGLGVTIWNLPLLVGSQSMAIWVVVPVILVLVAGIVWTRLRPDVNAEHLRVEAANARSTV